jgi:16S rRNA (uracil1498-N3)-methyltransferase
MPRSHATLPRLHVDMPLASGETVALGHDQVTYLVSVLRREPGDDVVLFNGRDGAWRCTIAEAGRKSVNLTAVEQIAAQTPPSDLWYGFAPLKAARLDYMIQKATEMGVGIIQPVITRRTQVTRIKLDRMRANALEAAEQCEVLTLPVIRPEIGLEALIAGWAKTEGDRVLIVADETAPSGSPVDALRDVAGRRVGLVIGPEGGFDDVERALLLRQSFVLPVSLGPRILRADTAAVAALAVIQSIIGDWR